MARATDKRRADLRDRLIDIADARIGAEGLSALRARDLAKEAGCAVGAIYNVFDDLTGLVLEVNARTFARLGSAVAKALVQTGSDPTERMIAMAQAYHRFAAAHQTHWRALFELDRPRDQPAPDWYLDDMGRLFSFIADPLAETFPDQSPGARALLARTVFSAVHGIVDLGLDDASGGIPADEIDAQLALFLGQFTGARRI